MTMSGMLTRTWNYLHQVTLDPGPGWSVPTKEQRHHLPPGLASWLHQVTSCLDSDQEREIVSRQLEVIVTKLSSKSVSPGVAGDCLVRLVHINLLGYDTSRAFIHCVKLAGSGSILSRKMGYLAVSVMIPPSHEVMVLMCGTILRDLASTNLVDIQLGLVAAANLITRSLISLVPLLLEKVTSLLRHSCHLVRKKSIALLDHLCDLEPSCWSEACSSVIGCLADSNPGVAVASVQVLSKHLSSSDSDAAVRLAVVASLEFCQRMTSEESELPADYQYRGHMVPHLQIYCVRVYRRASDQVTRSPDLSDQVISSLQSILNEFTGCKDLIIQALLYEAVLTISSLSTAACLLPLALRSVGGFLTSRHHSTVYTGLCALDAIFRQRPPRLTADQEAAVLSCLGHSDPAIQRRAAELLLVVASQENVMSIVDRVLAHVADSGASKTDYSMVVDRVVILVERFGDSVQDCDWKASTLLRIVQVSKNEQRDKMMERLKFLLTSSDEGDAATILELNRVRIRLRKLLSDIVTSRQEAGRPVPPPVTSLLVWCDAQFCDPEDEDTREVIQRTVDTAAANTQHTLVTLHCISAVQTLIMRYGKKSVGQIGLDFISKCGQSDDMIVRQRARSAASVVRHAPASPPSWSADASPDLTLSFLDRHIAQGIREGRMQPHRPRQSASVTSQGPGLITSPYHLMSRSPRDSERSWSPEHRDLDTPVRNVWTAEGRMATPEPSVQEEETKSEVENIRSDKTREPSSSASVITGDWD